MRILAGASRGLFRINGTGGPRQVLEEPGVREIVAIGARLHAGAGTGHYYSDDEGESWRRSNLPEREVWQIRPAANGVLYAGTQPAGLWRSDDDGERWTEIESFSRLAEAHDGSAIPITPPIPGRLRALVIDRANPDRILAGVEVGGIALSEDGGVTWTYAWKGITPRYSRPMCLDNRAPHALTVASAPTAFSHYKGENGAQAMLFRSTDGGESWRSLCDAAHSPSTANFHGLNVDRTRRAA